MTCLVVVTGAAGGIGAAVVERLARSGSRVIGADRAEPATRPGVLGKVRRLDVRDAEAVEAFVDSVESDDGPVSMLVNAAGVLTTGSALSAPTTAWREMFEVNTFGLMNVSLAVARRMVPRRHGAIVSVTSNAAKVPRVGMAAYAASKAAAEAFSHSLALELAENGIRCNTVAPGSTRTAMLTRLWSECGGEQQTLSGNLETYKPGIPLQRVAEPDDIARAVEFLLSPAAHHITMQSLTVDGGASLGR
jgi:2,3-dihydro-2,3-dihydroxybenzoate dehydrogenase